MMSPLDPRPLRTVDAGGSQRRDHNGLVVLDRQACFELLRTEHVGRIAVTDEGLPVILPISYALLDDEIVFCTGMGAKARAAIERDVVAFEVDRVDFPRQMGWSVCVVGITSEVVDPARRAAIDELDLRPLAPLDRTRHVSISAEIVTGRLRVAPDGRRLHPPALI